MTYIPIHGLSELDVLVSEIMRIGASASPRGYRTMDLSPAALHVIHPRDRLAVGPWRRMNPAFAFVEWLMIMTGDDAVDRIAFYASNMRQFSTDGVHVDGAYGPRVAPHITRLVDTLRADHDSRQAAITILTPDDLGKPNVPCTIGIQARIVEGKLDFMTFMRSNDAIWGFTYDAFCWTMLQEWVAGELNIPIGSYWHFTTSLHVYVDRDGDMLKRMEAECCRQHYPTDDKRQMPKPKPGTLLQLDHAEELARAGMYDQALRKAAILDTYWSDWVKVLVAWSMRKHRQDLKVTAMVTAGIAHRDLRELIERMVL